MLSDSNTTNNKPNSQPRIAALYARVSTGRQEEQETIDPQIDEVKNRILADGNILPSENIFQDDGWTGEMLQRPGLDLMRDGADAGNFQTLYVYDRGRLSRVFAYQEIIIEELINKGIEFVTLHDVKAETPEERVMQAMQGVFHEYERVKIAERFRRGKMYKAKNNVLINGHALYGYDYFKKVEEIRDGVKHIEPARYEINEEEAKVVKDIWTWFAIEGVSKNEIIKRLYDRGIFPKKRKSDFWTKGPIDRVLKCESYVTGLIYYNKSEAIVARNPLKNVKYRKVKKNSRRVRPRDEWLPFKVPKIIEDYALYERNLQRLEYNKKYACKKRKYEYLLTGLAYCECGHPRVGDGGDNGHYYYRCSERIYNFPMKKTCNLKGFNAVTLDQVFWNHLEGFLTDPVKLKEATEHWLKTEANKEADVLELNKHQELIEKINEEEKRYAKTYAEQQIDFDQLKELMRDAKKRKQIHIKRVDELQTNIVQESVNDVDLEKICFEVEKLIKTLDLSNKNQTIRYIITKVLMKGDNRVQVKGRFPLFALNMGYEPISRNCWVTKRWEKHTFQCVVEKAAGVGCELSVCDD